MSVVCSVDPTQPVDGQIVVSYYDIVSLEPGATSQLVPALTARWL